MTLPTNITLPLDERLLSSDNPKDLLAYQKALIYNLSTYLQQANYSANGRTVSYTQATSFQFIQGSTTPGSATYTNTILQVFRTNLTNFANFDITWTGHTGTGNLLITLPYFCTSVTQYPYVGTIESDGISFTSGYTYLTLNLAPSTNTITVNQNGSGEALIPLPIPSSGHIRGSIIYAGNQFN